MKGVVGGFLARRGGMLPVAVTAIVVVGLFGYESLDAVEPAGTTSAPSCGWSGADAFNPKEVALDVLGPPGTVATTAQPAVFVNVMAQGDGDSIGCRVTIDGVVEEQRAIDTASAACFLADQSG